MYRPRNRLVRVPNNIGYVSTNLGHLYEVQIPQFVLYMFVYYSIGRI